VRHTLVFTAEEIAFLRTLRAAKVRFMVVGLSAAALQGAPMVTQDVDLWFRDLAAPGIRRALRRVGGTFVPAVDLSPPMFAGEGVDLFDIVLTVHGIDSFDAEYKNALDVPLGDFSVKVLPLDRIIQSKRYLGREKDLMALPALRSAARALDPKTRHRP